MARFVVFIANFENFTQCSGASIVKFEHINAGWEKKKSFNDIYGISKHLNIPQNH